MSRMQRELKDSKKDNISAFLMIFPAIFLLVVTSIYPFFWLFRYVLYMALQLIIPALTI